MFDPITMKKYALNTHQYFNFENEFNIIPYKGNETLFNIQDIYREDTTFNSNVSLANIDIKFARVEVTRDKDGK